LPEILLLVVSAVLSGAEGWEAMEEFGKEKLDWLRKFAPFANGIPSHDCIATVISRLRPKAFQSCFVDWTRAVAEATDGEVVAVDGKTARGVVSHPDPQTTGHFCREYPTGDVVFR
jgi:hypothetical protein